MRIIFFLLALLNLAFFIFNWFNQPNVSAQEDFFSQQGVMLEIRGEGALKPQSTERKVRNSYCLAIGPWAEFDAAERSRLVNAQTGLVGKVEKLSLRKNQLHWVYLPAYKTREEAARMLKELHYRGVDSFIVTEGEDQNAVSLGYFSNKESAIGLQTKMVSSGYSVELRETWKDLVEYWLVFDIAPHEQNSSKEVYSSAELEGITVMQVSCEKEAP